MAHRTDAGTSTHLSAASSLSLTELAGLLRIEFDATGIDQGIGFTLRRVQQGAALYRAGDPFDGIYAIRSGTFKIVLRDANGSYQVLGFPIAGETLGLDGIEALQYASEAVTLEDSEVAVLPSSLLARLSGEGEELQQFVYRLLSRQLASQHMQVWLLGTLSADAKVACIACWSAPFGGTPYDSGYPAPQSYPRL
jgi:CRP/FNR family transcriptional regulator